jgi:histone H3/H4
MIVNALREIKYYQSTLMSDKLVIPKGVFTRLVREILQAQLRREWGPEHMMRQPDWRIEEDALVCLQTMSEHIVVMMMEMW